MASEFSESSSSLWRDLSTAFAPHWYVVTDAERKVLHDVVIHGWDGFLDYVKEQSENGNFDVLIQNADSKAKTPNTWPTIKSLPFQICGKTFTLNVHVRVFRDMVTKQLEYTYGLYLEHLPYREKSLFISGFRAQIMDQTTGEWLSGGTSVDYHNITFSFSTSAGFESKLDRGWNKYFPFVEEHREIYIDDKPSAVFYLDDDKNVPKTNPFEQRRGNLRFRLSFWPHYSHCHVPTAECVICCNPLRQFVTSKNKECCHKNICADCFFELVERHKTTTFACPTCRAEGRWRFKSGSPK